MANGKGSRQRPPKEKGLYEKNYIGLDWDNHKSGTGIAIEESQCPDDQLQDTNNGEQ